MSQLVKITLISLCGLFFSCTKNSDSDLSASATAEMSSDGTVVIREATSEDLARIDRIDTIMAKINKNFPGAITPVNAKLYKAVRLTPPGIVVLTDGRQFQIDGISCDTDGVHPISEYAIGETISVAIVPSGPPTDQPLRADIWAVDTDTSEGRPILSFTNLGQTALISNWCTLSTRQHAKYAARYSALSKAFSSNTQ